jgi:hypothetical protein
VLQRRHLPVTQKELQEGGVARMREAFRRSAAGFSRPQVLGPAAAFCFHTRPHFVPPEAAVIAASKHRGKAQPEVAAVHRDGNIVQTGSVFVQEQSAQRWAAGTIANKDVVVSQFKSFLESAGLPHVLMDKPPEHDVKPMSMRRREENLLATWGMMRVMSGQRMKGETAVITKAASINKSNCPVMMELVSSVDATIHEINHANLSRPDGKQLKSRVDIVTSLTEVPPSSPFSLSHFLLFLMLTR